MNPYILLVIAVLFISLMVFAIYTLTRENNTEAEIQKIIDTQKVGQIYADYKKQMMTLNWFTVAGVLFTGAFAVTFFSGGEIDPFNWTLSQWIFSGMAVIGTIALTLGQRSLYQSVDHNKAALTITMIILVFVYFSEIATTMEREDTLVRERSLNSPTLQATLGTIQNSVQTAGSVTGSEIALAKARAEKKKYEKKYSECKSNKCRKWRKNQIDNRQANIDQFAELAGTQQQAKTNYLTSLVTTAKSLEYDETNHASIIRAIKEAFNASFLAAAMFAAFLFINAFEAGFHFIGTRVGILKAALLQLDFDLDPEPPSKEDINAEIEAKRLKKRAKFQKKTAKHKAALVKLEKPENKPPPLPAKKQEKNEQKKPTVPPENNRTRTLKNRSIKPTVRGTPKRPGTSKKQGQKTPDLEPKNSLKNNQNVEGKTSTKQGANYSERALKSIRALIIHRKITPSVRQVKKALIPMLKGFSMKQKQEVAEDILGILFDESIILINPKFDQQKKSRGVTKYVLNESARLLQLTKTG